MYIHIALWTIAACVCIAGGRFARIVLIEAVDFLTDGIYGRNF